MIQRKSLRELNRTTPNPKRRLAGSIAGVLCFFPVFASAETIAIDVNHDWTIEVFGKTYGAMELGYGSNRSLIGSEATTEFFIADRLICSVGAPIGWIAGALAAMILMVAITIGLIRRKRESRAGS